MAIIAVNKQKEKEVIVGVGRYFMDQSKKYAELAFVVRDNYQNKGIFRELLSYLVSLAKKQGLLGFAAEVLL
jgi:GNAT superfamily N-acetyltransferase